MKSIFKTITIFCYLLASNSTEAQVFHDNTSYMSISSIYGAENHTQDSIIGDFKYHNNGTGSEQRAILYSTDAYQSNDGFKLTVEYTAGSIDNLGSHNFSFGLIRSDTELSTYTGFNPFKSDNSVYSMGVNLTANEDATARGFNFTNGTERVTLDESGTSVQFATGESTKVFIEIGVGGFWSYYINDIYEASGVLVDGFDLTKSYHIAVYAQDDNGGEKSIQSLKLEKQYAAGERAKEVRGTWTSVAASTYVDQVKDFKTLDYLVRSFNSGATQSANHSAPNKLLENLWQGDLDANNNPINLVVPLWGDLSLDEPENDPMLERIVAIKAAGFKFKAYSNCKNLLGGLASEYEVIAERWKEFCDTDPEMQAFINSQPFHTGVWNRTTQQYEDASDTYPSRKYMFCWAEFILKDYSLRYGHLIDSWIFDSGDDISNRGDNATSGIIEEQRLYQAFANAVHAGNPDIPIAFNNGRSTINYAAYPFAHAIRFEDFTFGHAFGGNNDHASVSGGQFGRNYFHVERIVETNGSVHDGGNWTWDDQVVGNFHSKLATTSWSSGPIQAWQETDFLQWNLEALQAGGAMTWGGSNVSAGGITQLRPWAYDLLKALDDHLAEKESPASPNWARGYTLLPEATIGQAYYHLLKEGIDLWDPEGDDIIAISSLSNAPSWLNISEDIDHPGNWILSGIPDEASPTLHEFELQATDDNGHSGAREVALKVNEGTTTLTDLGDGIPVWIAPSIKLETYNLSEFSYTMTRGLEFADFDGDTLTIEIVGDPLWLTLEEFSPGIWILSGTPECAKFYELELALSDGTHTINTTLEINVTDNLFPEMGVNVINGNASWTSPSVNPEITELVYNQNSVNFDHRALLYSTQSFQSNDGFTLKVDYTTGKISNSVSHNFSFGLISTDTDMSNYNGFNPFSIDTTVYSIGLNLTADHGVGKRGLNFTDQSTVVNLDQSGTNVQFATNVSTEVILQVRENGIWSYSIGGIEEATGSIPAFDFAKSYHIVVYGQDDNGNGKSIQSISLSTCPTLCFTQEEICDGIDNNGDGTIDEKLTNTWIGPSHGNWYDNTAYWSLCHFPNKCNQVVIDSSYSVTLKNGEIGYGNTFHVKQGAEFIMESGAGLEIKP